VGDRAGNHEVFHSGRDVGLVPARTDDSGDEMTGSDEEQEDFWSATMTLTRE
jgi:hypothetical protein